MAKRSVKAAKRPPMKPKRLRLEKVGPIVDADVEFGDLTVLVGPQASGKSILLQTLELVADTRAVQAELSRVNIDWRGDPALYFGQFYGEGMGSLWSADSAMSVDGKSRPLPELSRLMKGPRSRGTERVFYIPAQRVMSLRDGLTRPFMDFRSGEPYVLREFSERLHWLVQNEFGQDDVLFPRSNRLKSDLRTRIAESIFGGFSLAIDRSYPQKRIVLSAGSGAPLPYAVWSAGQREFTPLLLGLYWLMPPARVARRNDIEWVVIEEPEMGLHPDAISVVMMIVLELLHRGYRVCLSTHSPHVLDVVWAMRVFQENQGTARDVQRALRFTGAGTAEIAAEALHRVYKVYFLDRNCAARDISRLDPGAESTAESGWGRLTGGEDDIGEVVADVVVRAEARS